MEEASERRMAIIKHLYAEGEFLFDQVMEKACRHSLWLPSEVASAGAESDLEDKGSLIFQVAFEDALKVELAEKIAERERTAEKS